MRPPTPFYRSLSIDAGLGVHRVFSDKRKFAKPLELMLVIFNLRIVLMMGCGVMINMKVKFLNYGR